MSLNHNQMAYVAIVSTLIFGSLFVGVSGFFQTSEEIGGYESAVEEDIRGETVLIEVRRAARPGGPRSGWPDLQSLVVVCARRVAAFAQRGALVAEAHHVHALARSAHMPNHGLHDAAERRLRRRIADF